MPVLGPLPRVRRRAPLESPIERKVVKKAFEDLAVRSTKLNTRSDTGWPDRIFWLPTTPFLIEFKRPGKAPGKKQDHVHGMLRKLGYDVEWHDTFDGAMNAIVKRLRRMYHRRSLVEIVDLLTQLNA